MVVRSAKPNRNIFNQGCAARELKFCGPRKGQGFNRVLPIFRGWRASCVNRKAQHMQL